MTNIKNLFAVSATLAALVATHGVFAQDDLDNLLKDLESEASAKKPAAQAEASASAAEAAAAPAAAAPAAESQEESAEEKKAEAEPAAEDKPVEQKKVEESVAAVNELASEAKPKKAAAPAADAELIANLRATETLRRVALDTQAKREIEAARACMEDEALPQYFGSSFTTTSSKVGVVMVYSGTPGQSG